MTLLKRLTYQPCVLLCEMMDLGILKTETWFLLLITDDILIQTLF